MRIQRGGASLNHDQYQKLYKRIKNNIIELSSYKTPTPQQITELNRIKTYGLSEEQQTAILTDVSNSKIAINNFTNPQQGSIEAVNANKVIIDSIFKISPLLIQPPSIVEAQRGNEESAVAAAAAATESQATTPSWYKIPEERKPDWIAAVSTLDISNILVPLIESGNITPDAYIEVLARQNDLFKLAFDIIRGKVTAKIGEELQDAFTLVDHAKDISDTLMEYINDVEKLILKSVEPGNTKLGSIRSLNENIFELLLFPDRLQNLLIKAVANICVMLADDKNYNLVKNKELLPLLIKQYSSYAEALAYSQTAVAMRDGYYLSQNLTKIQLDRTAILSLEEGYTAKRRDESLTAFWKDFIVTLYDLPSDGTGLFKIPVLEGCDKSVNGMSWGQIAANICMMYKRKMIVDKNYKEAILGIFDGSCNLIVTEDISGAPPMALWGERLTKIFTYIRPDTLEFMLHLAYEITRAAKRAATEAAAPLPSLEQEQSNSQGSGV
jgi:hypothetical protein